MAPHLSKKQQSSDNVQRPNIWRFISVSRFGQRPRRNSAGEDGHDHVRHAGLPSPHYDEPPYDESDGSDSILNDEDAADARSVFSESQYSDAHSTWDPPLTNREDAISFAFSELLQPDAHNSSPEIASSSTLRHGANAHVRQGPSRTAMHSTTDAVVNFQGLENQFDAYFARAPPSTVFPGSQPMAVDPFSTENTSGHQRQRDQSARGIFGSSRKGKEVEGVPDWSSAANPWALLQASNPEPNDRDAILKENARLRAEIDELKAITAKEKAVDSLQADPGSPLQSPGPRTSSRLRRSRNKKRQDVTLFQTMTLRDLVLKRLFTPHVIVDGIIHDAEQPLTLDTPLTEAQVHDFTRIMNDIIVSGSHLKQPIALCAVCHLPKFKGIKTLHQNSYVSEVLAQLPMVSASAFEDFDPVWGTSTCCRRFVCKTCLSAAIISGISTHWWFDLQNRESNWLKCPVPCCGRNLPLHSSDEISAVMQKLGVHDIGPYLERYRRAARFRSQLQGINPLPGKDELRRSKALHERLVRHKHMRPLFEDSVGDDNDEELGVECLPIDTPDGRGIMKIPFFKRRLRNCTPRTCLVCDETYNEFNAGSPENWNKVIKGFGGEWTWRILAFPTYEVLPNCQHTHAICRGCLAKYVTTQVESQGHSVVENIACPIPDCQHKYNYAEIRSLATAEAFSLYDRYAVLKSISSQHNFRWCLREGCVAGSLYDDPSTTPPSDSADTDPNCIECAECSFTMCYTCQTPWHPGLTCVQVASQQSDSFTETQTWLAQHTKPCPGEACGVQVQKGDGCFHMTCSRCHFEFCWECLADWRDIFVPDDDGGYLKADGHREGCFFRGEGAPLPTLLNGQDVETGLRRLEQADAVPAAAPAVAG